MDHVYNYVAAKPTAPNDGLLRPLQRTSAKGRTYRISLLEVLLEGWIEYETQKGVAKSYASTPLPVA